VHAVRALAGAALLATLLIAAPAHGAPCGRPDLVDMVPPEGARDVPLDAQLGAHYQVSAEYLGEPVRLIRLVDGQPPEEQSLAATFDSTEGFLSVTPPQPLVPGGRYVIQWPALRGLNAAAQGTGGEAHFEAGSGVDREPPTFGGFSRMSWDVERRESDCTDATEERMIFDLELDAAADDGGRAGLTLLVFQTAGPLVRDAPNRVHARALPDDPLDPVRLSLTTSEAVGRVCFAAILRDMTDKVSNSSGEICAGVTAPPFFRGCQLASSGAGGPGELALVWTFVFLAASLARARRRS
jgi:hypothetical protein